MLVRPHSTRRIGRRSQAGPKLTLRLDIDLPHAPEEVEVVHQDPTHKCLKRPVDVTQIHALFQHLVLVDIGKDLRDARDEGGVHGGEFGPLRATSRNFCVCSARNATSLPERSSSMNDDAARGADAGNSRWREEERLGFS